MNQHPLAPRKSSTILTARWTAAALALAATLATSVPASAQDLHPSRRPSPVGIAKLLMGDTYVKVTYGRPYMRGRAVFGAAGDSTTYLVPFGEVWRTGANEATELTTTGPLMVAGKRLEAGTYSIFTVPGATSWSIRFSPELGLDGTNRMDEATGRFVPGYDPEGDVLRVDVPTHTTDEVVDQFTVALDRTAQGADLVLSWERTEVRVPLAVAR
ncbi:MAG TPA: DUF2911 domain-containing protein [Longimicrobiales bacterium]|nr:DUF2911 domain-containing protein [Longimicrobiales bacterium]